MWEKYFSEQQQDDMKTFSGIQKLEGFIIGAIEKQGNASDKRKMIADGNLDPYKGIKSQGNADYIGKYVRFFLTT